MITVRRATVEDAAAMGSLYVRVWQDVYPGIIPNETLLAMCPSLAAERWQAAIRASGGRRAAVVAEGPAQTAVQAPNTASPVTGIGNFGPNWDDALGFDGEIFTLYVDPDHIGQGAGSALLAGMFGAMADAGMTSALVWTLSLSPQRFFYEAMGARRMARKTERIAGMPVELSAYGWSDLGTVLGRYPRARLSRLAGEGPDAGLASEAGPLT